MEEATYRQMAEIQSSHWWYEGRRKIIRSLVRNMFLPGCARILEAGCGPGANLGMLSRCGRVEAFEPDDFARQHASRISGLPVVKGHLPDGVPQTGPFDLVCALDVIEHLEEDEASLKSLRAVMKTDGYALFTVPAYTFLWSRHDEVNHHKRRYVLPQFKAVLERAGYRVERISYYNTFLFPVVAVVRFIKRVLRMKGSPDEKMPRIPFVNAALLQVFAAERHFLRWINFPFGVSIVAICRKS